MKLRTVLIGLCVLILFFIGYKIMTDMNAHDAYSYGPYLCGKNELSVNQKKDSSELTFAFAGYTFTRNIHDSELPDYVEGPDVGLSGFGGWQTDVTAEQATPDAVIREFAPCYEQHESEIYDAMSSNNAFTYPIGNIRRIYYVK